MVSLAGGTKYDVLSKPHAEYIFIGLYTDNSINSIHAPVQMLLTGEMISADAAAEMGLINTAVDADELDDAVATLAAGIASKVQRWEEEEEEEEVEVEEEEEEEEEGCVVWCCELHPYADLPGTDTLFVVPLPLPSPPSLFPLPRVVAHPKSATAIRMGKETFYRQLEAPSLGEAYAIAGQSMVDNMLQVGFRNRNILTQVCI
jgi:enoyl-CoA hydratase/carnithine racemase